MSMTRATVICINEKGVFLEKVHAYHKVYHSCFRPDRSLLCFTARVDLVNNCKNISMA